MKKKALVLAGGGSRGSYQIGVWRALRELGWNFDIVTGTSVGALNGALVVQNDFDIAVDMWENIATSDVLSIELDDKIASLRDFNTKLGLFLGEMAKNGGADPRPLEEILRRCVDEVRIRNSPVDFKFVTVEYPSLTPRVMSKENLPEGELVDYLMASAACFPAMKMRQIGAAKYIDGGYYDNMPVSLAAESGAEEIVAVDLEAVGRKKRVVEAPGVRVRYIRSKWDLGVFILFDKEVAKRNMVLGYLDAMKEFGKLEGTAYSFQKGETAANARALCKQFDLISVKTGFSVRRYSKLALEPNVNIRLTRIAHSERVGMTSDSAIAAAGETAARVFGLSPLETYTFAQLNEKLLDELFQIHTENLAELTELLGNGKNARDVLRALGKVDKRHVAAFCHIELRRAYERGATPLLGILGKLVGAEFAAGFYLFALELSGGLRAAN